MNKSKISKIVVLILTFTLIACVSTSVLADDAIDLSNSLNGGTTDTTPEEPSVDKEVLKKFARKWICEDNKNILNIKEDMTFSIEKNSAVVDEGTFTIDENGEHIILNYKNGTKVDYKLEQTSYFVLKSNDATDKYMEYEAYLNIENANSNTETTPNNNNTSTYPESDIPYAGPEDTIIMASAFIVLGIIGVYTFMKLSEYSNI